MLEMTVSREEHRDTVPVGLPYGILIADTSSRLHYCLYPVFSGKRDTVIEREEPV